VYYMSTVKSGKYFIAEMHTLTSGVHEIINIITTNEPNLFWPEGDILNIEDSLISDESGIIEKIFTVNINWENS